MGEEPTDELGFPLYLAGQIRDLTALIAVLLRTHPDHRLLRRHIEAIDLVATAKAGAAPVAEEYLDGYREVVEAARTLLGGAGKNP